MFYGADETPVEDARFAEIAITERALVKIVNNLPENPFITPTIIDRDPLNLAIGTEGSAPFLANAIKTDPNAHLPTKK